MKKLNHIWVFSDSITGHEIQSLALASKIANSNTLFHCGLRQPWLSFAPRILPRFEKNIIWKKSRPDIKLKPDAIITCGRRMAAIGKFYKRKVNCKHIQILNPKDNPNKYDVVICPEHDNLVAKNVIKTKGSLHTITASHLLPYKKSNANKSIALLLGNPGKKLYKELKQLADNIAKNYPDYDLFICGSRRTSKKLHSHIRKVFHTSQACWLDNKDGENPYLNLLANAEILMVTADSINMVSEACATNSTVIALAQNYTSKKHMDFIHSLQDRLSDFGSFESNAIALDTLTLAAQNTLIVLNNKP